MNDETEQAQTQQPPTPPVDGAPEGLQQPEAQLTPDEVVAIGSEAVSTMLATDTASPPVADSTQATPEALVDGIEAKGDKHISETFGALRAALDSFVSLPPEVKYESRAKAIAINLAFKGFGLLSFGLLAKAGLSGHSTLLADSILAGAGLTSFGTATLQTMGDRLANRGQGSTTLGGA